MQKEQSANVYAKSTTLSNEVLRLVSKVQIRLREWSHYAFDSFPGLCYKTLRIRNVR